MAYRCAQLMGNTTMGPGEVRHVCVQDVDLERRILNVVHHTKNQYRVRAIPLNELALEAVRELLERAHVLGAVQPGDYLVPLRVSTGHYDPSRPASESFIRTAFVGMRYVADLPNLRIYDMRHHALTKLCEDPTTSEETIRSIAGHVSREMMQWYSHVRIEARREAVEALDFRKKRPGRVVTMWKRKARLPQEGQRRCKQESDYPVTNLGYQDQEGQPVLRGSAYDCRGKSRNEGFLHPLSRQMGGMRSEHDWCSPQSRCAASTLSAATPHVCTGVRRVGG